MIVQPTIIKIKKHEIKCLPLSRYRGTEVKCLEKMCNYIKFLTLFMSY